MPFLRSLLPPLSHSLPDGAEISRIRPFLAGALCANESRIIFATIVGQCLELLVLCIMVRIFNQHEIGALHILLSQAAMATPLLCGSYHFTLPSIQSDEEAVAGYVGLLLLGLFTSLVFALVSSFWLNVMPTTVWVLLSAQAVMLVTGQMHIRISNFNLLAISRVINPLLGVFVFSTLYAQSDPGDINLIHLMAFISAASTVLLAVLTVIVLARRGYTLPTLAAFRSVIGRQFAQIRYPMMMAPSQLLNSAAYNLPISMIGWTLGEAASAQYAIALRFALKPASLICTPVRSVIHAKAAAAVRSEEGGLLDTYLHSRRSLRWAGLLLGLAIATFAAPVVVWVIGWQWIESAVMVMLLSPLCASMVMVTPLSICLVVLDKQHLVLANQLLYLMISLISFLIGGLAGSLMLAVVLFSVLSTIRYVWLDRVLLNSLNVFCESKVGDGRGE